MGREVYGGAGNPAQRAGATVEKPPTAALPLGVSGEIAQPATPTTPAPRRSALSEIAAMLATSGDFALRAWR